MKRKSLLKIINFWPPFLGAGISVTKIAKDFTSIDVKLKLHFWNKNYVGTQFGGSLYSMADPFFMLILIENLGPGYEVWDKSGSIRYIKPGRGTVHATFQISKEEIEALRVKADRDGKVEPVFEASILDENNQVVAIVSKTIQIKLKKTHD